MKFGSVKFKTQLGKLSTADLYIVTGYFFSIVFSVDSHPLKNKDQEIEVLDVRIHQNPMVNQPEEPDHVDMEPIFSGWLKDWESKYNIHDKKSALEQSARKRMLANISASLPADYLELTLQSDGFQAESCTILGLSEIHGIVMPDGDYYVLVEVENEGVIAVMSGSTDTMLYFLDFDENPAEPLGESFKGAAENILTSYRKKV